MPKVRRRFKGSTPPAEEKKRFTYDDGATDPAAAEAKAKAKGQAEKPARKAATKK